MNSAATSWTISPGGGDGECIYLSGSQNSDECGPEDKFRSSQTEGSANIFNSSLSVVSVTEAFNRTQVNCTNGDNNALNGSDHICITGKFLCHYKHTFYTFHIIS